jgi:hypothetical protein
MQRAIVLWETALQRAHRASAWPQRPTHAPQRTIEL